MTSVNRLCTFMVSSLLFFKEFWLLLFPKLIPNHFPYGLTNFEKNGHHVFVALTLIHTLDSFTEWQKKWSSYLCQLLLFVFKHTRQFSASITVIANETDIPFYCASVHQSVNNSRIVVSLHLMSLLVRSILIWGSCSETESPLKWHVFHCGGGGPLNIIQLEREC